MTGDGKCSDFVPSAFFAIGSGKEVSPLVRGLLCGKTRVRFLGALSIQPKIPEISVGTSNGTDQFGLVRPEYSRPAIKAVHFDRSGHFGRLDRKIPFHLTKLLSPVPLFWILLTKTITKRAVAWVGSVQPECTVPLGTWNFRNFKPEFLINGKCPRGYLKSLFRLLSFIQCSFKWFTFANLSLLLVTNVK